MAHSLAKMASVAAVLTGIMLLSALAILSPRFSSSTSLLENSVPSVPPQFPGSEAYEEVPSAQDRRSSTYPMWGYSDGEEWGKEYEGWEICDSGRKQSPINIKRSYWGAFWKSKWAEKYLAKDHHPFVWQIGDHNVEEKDGKTQKCVHFDGHKIFAPYKVYDINAEWRDGQRYHLEEMTLHTPSEHTIDGQHYPLEVQFIHRAWSQAEDGGNKKHELAVSVLFSPALQSVEFIEALAAAVKEAAGQHDGDYEALRKQLEHPGQQLEMSVDGFSQLARDVLMQVEMPLELKGHLHHDDNALRPVQTFASRHHLFDLPDATVPNYRAYWSYEGSRTEPPCTEDVTWVVLKHSLPATADDLHVISSLQGTNDRKTQPLNHRLVYDSSA